MVQNRNDSRLLDFTARELSREIFLASGENVKLQTVFKWRKNGIPFRYLPVATAALDRLERERDMNAAG